MPKTLGVITLLLLSLTLISSCSATSIRIDDPLTDVYYDVINPDGSIYIENLNSSDVCNFTTDGHYTIILHAEPLRVANDPGSFYQNMINYGYGIIMLIFCIFIGVALSGVALGLIIGRRKN